ncbi:hypothetical protein NB640_11125 [Oxalobacter vibrioformis]|uniref:Uncharacterized protein n=1 Tax=Oxalobacter vibrioformis TaxID=933080 RepID=A0A9E9P2D3_9BURK|nr:hypothetical protein [Oxalobacter vibrioformis]NLC24068.1 hypothetical protein [Oxalobacter sp.]WAW09764.1 hypothetical protein NB640_11125 [Oxalobacter vibrioformis]
MNFLESKGVRVETVRPMMGKIKNRELSPESYHLHIGDDEKWITLDTTDEMLYMQAREIDPEDMESVFRHLKTLRNRINWLI